MSTGPSQKTSFKNDIRPLFRDVDVQHMIDATNLDLSSYEAVRDSKDVIYNRIRGIGGRRMPPDKPWTQTMIDKFKQWIDDGTPP